MHNKIHISLKLAIALVCTLMATDSVFAKDDDEEAERRYQVVDADRCEPDAVDRDRHLTLQLVELDGR